MNNSDFKKYYDNIDEKITNILLSPSKDELTYDIMDTKKQRKNKLVALKEKQRQMKVGDIMQTVLGNYPGFKDLEKGHESGLDIISEERKIVAEIKNRTNTDNASAKKVIMIN